MNYYGTIGEHISPLGALTIAHLVYLTAARVSRGVGEFIVPTKAGSSICRNESPSKSAGGQ
jgi:hypothetical protein